MQELFGELSRIFQKNKVLGEKNLARIKMVEWRYFQIYLIELDFDLLDAKSEMVKMSIQILS